MLFDDSEIVAPPLGAAALRVIVPMIVPPAVTVKGEKVKDCKAAAGGAGLTVAFAVRVDPLYEAVMTTFTAPEEGRLTR